MTQAKGKIERFHRRFRGQFLTEINLPAINDLAELNAKLWVWIEKIYHLSSHDGLEKNLTPLSRWQNDLLKITPLGNKAAKLDEYFYHRIKRWIRKDGTVSWNNRLFEVAFEYAQRSVYLVVDPHTVQAKWIESLDADYLGPIHPLDKLANNHRKRSRPKPPVAPKQSPAKTYLVDSAFEKTTQQLDITPSND